MSDKKRRLVAYHEAGHAIVGALMPEYDPVTKISIVPRGAAGGLTFFAPSEERLESGLYSRCVQVAVQAVHMWCVRGWCCLIWAARKEGQAGPARPSLRTCRTLMLTLNRLLNSSHLTGHTWRTRWLWPWAAALLRS